MRVYVTITGSRSIIGKHYKLLFILLSVLLYADRDLGDVFPSVNASNERQERNASWTATLHPLTARDGNHV